MPLNTAMAALPQATSFASVMVPAFGSAEAIGTTMSIQLYRGKITTSPWPASAQEPTRGGRFVSDALILPRPSAIDLISHAIWYVRPHLDRSIPVTDRVRNLWAAVVAARDLGTSDVIEDEFLRLASDSGLAHDLGRHADNDLRHVIRWAMRNRNPFQ